MSHNVLSFTKSFRTAQLLFPELLWANALGVSCYPVVDPTQFDSSQTAEGRQCGPPAHNNMQFCPTCQLLKKDMQR